MNTERLIDSLTLCSEERLRELLRIERESAELLEKLAAYTTGMPDSKYLAAVAKYGQQSIDSNAMSSRDYDEQKKYYDWLKRIAAQTVEGIQ